jgi:hypothetical protein
MTAMGDANAMAVPPAMREVPVMREVPLMREVPGMRDPMDAESPRPAAINDCVLCRFWGSDEAMSQGLETYISSSLGRVHMSEICRQVAETVAQRGAEFRVDEADVRTHVEEHMLCKGVLMERMVCDLAEVMKHSQRACFVQTEDGCHVIDPKNVATYLKTVSQMADLLKMEHFRTR